MLVVHGTKHEHVGGMGSRGGGGRGVDKLVAAQTCELAGRLKFSRAAAGRRQFPSDAGSIGRR